ncbi:MAG: RNA polymerase sigma factor [Planctomycetota bacterium]|jgi:RNA polymerase sigma factor (sigma-70 family)
MTGDGKPAPGVTCWTLISGAADGDPVDRAEFSQRYLPLVHRCFSRRWRDSALQDCVDDAVQEVFLECFRSGGALSRADRKRLKGFRMFLLGVVRNVALRAERSSAKRAAPLEPGSFHGERIPSDDERISHLFDRVWAESLIRQAAERMRSSRDPQTARDAELLDLRFQEGLPIREIAVRWQEDPALVHRAYSRARNKFRECLRDLIRFDRPCASKEEHEKELRKLVSYL